MSTAKTSTMRSPGNLPSSPAPTRLMHEYPNISPTLRKLVNTPKHGGSYGCVQEVLHPNSKDAEPLAQLLYDSDNDPEANDVESAALPRSAAHVEDSSPLASRTNIPATRSGNDPTTTLGQQLAFAGNTARASLKPMPTSSAPRTGCDFNSAIHASRKRTSQAAVSVLFGVDFTSLHISRSLEEETQAKRSRNTGFPTNIRYPDIDDSIVGESAVELEADETGIDIADTPKDKGKGVARDPPQGLLDELEESPNISTPGSSKTSRNSLPIVTPARNKNMLPTTSPRVYPLPESPNGSDDSSLNESPVLPPTGSPTNFLSPSANRNGKNPSIARSEAMVKRYAILNIKAYEYTELTFRPASEKKIAAELDAIYSKENRFDPQEAALLEEEFQRKVRIVHDRKAEEEFREAEMEREEQERIRTIEAAKKAAEEQKRREQAERARKEQEQIEKKRAEEETIKAQAEQKRKEAAEAKRQADEKARLEREAKDKANKEQAAAKAAADATAQAQAAQAAQAAQVAQAAQPQQQAPTQPTPSTPLIQQPLVPGRKSFANDSANVKRVITNLKGLKKLGDQFLKESGLKQLRRDMIPKLGQLTGQKQQTIIVRDAIKSMLLEAMNIQSPSAPLSQYVFTAPSSDVGVQVGYIWIVNELAKMAVGQILSECLSSHELADPVGVVIASIFADPKFAVGGKSLIDIFIARFCKRCPILLGEFGPCLTKGDRVRLGWKVEEDGEIRESESSYTERMQAYTAGFVALAGRDFARSPNSNPYPPFNLWFLLAGILNTPPDKLTDTHYYTVTTILRAGGKKLCGLYGKQAKKLIEVAIGPFADAGLATGKGGAHAVQSTGAVLTSQEWWRQIRA